MNDAWHAAWVAALDDLEGTLADTERLLRGDVPEEPAAPPGAPGATGWTPPALPCPLPADLVHRAENLLARQRLLMAEAATAVGSMKQQAGLVKRMESRAGLASGPRPVYVDLTA